MINACDIFSATAGVGLMPLRFEGSGQERFDALSKIRIKQGVTCIQPSTLECLALVRGNTKNRGTHRMLTAFMNSRRVISLVITISLICGIAAAKPHGRPSQKRKPALRTARFNSRGGSPRARGRAGLKYNKVRVRGRDGRWRWKRVAIRTASGTAHTAGVYNFLTSSWSTAQSQPGLNYTTEPLVSPQPAPVQPSTQPGADERAANSAVQPADRAAPNMVSNAVSNTPGVPVNTLVQAYVDSLESRGFNSDNQGFIVETLDGQVLASHNGDRAFNPASVVKVATSLVAISKLGPDYRFRTSLYTNGTVDPATGTLHGSLYLQGTGDPAFFNENAMLIADQLNRNGIRAVDGNLIVQGLFCFNFSTAREAAAKAFRAALNPDTWTAAAKAAYPRFLSMKYAEERASSTGDSGARPVVGPPCLKISGQTITDSQVGTAGLRLLAVHTSLPLVRVLKGLNDFSNNWMATVIGSQVGGPDAVERFLSTEVGLKDEELRIATASGLGTNLVSPRAMALILRKLIAYLNKERLGIEELLPVAGIDAGTLEKRFTDVYRGAVVGKTGTLGSQGASALAGVAFTRTRGPLVFVIFNKGRAIHAFHEAQDETIRKVITFCGGPAPIRYNTNVAPRLSPAGAASQR